MITAKEANEKAKIIHEEEFDSAIKSLDRRINEKAESGNNFYVTCEKILINDFKRVKKYYNELGFKVKKYYDFDMFCTVYIRVDW